MPEFAIELEISAPPALVFSKLRDPDLLPTWLPGVIRCEPRIGTIGKERSQYALIVAEGTDEILLEEEVAEYLLDEELTVFTEAPSSVTKTRYLLSPIEGGTNLRVEIDISGKNFLQEIGLSLAKSRQRERLLRSLEQFKVIVEANAQAVVSP